MFAEVREIYDMSAVVTKRNGETHRVQFCRLSKPFKGKFGNSEGKDCVYAVPITPSRIHSNKKLRGNEDLVRWFEDCD